MNNKLKITKKNIVMRFIPFTEKKWNLLDFRTDPESDQDPEL